jgi:YggT family protein
MTTEVICTFIEFLTRALIFAIIARALASWFVQDQSNPIVQMLHDITEPIVGPVRRIMPSTGMMDFSPLVALILLQILETLLVRLICS